MNAKISLALTMDFVPTTPVTSPVTALMTTSDQHVSITWVAPTLRLKSAPMVKLAGNTQLMEEHTGNVFKEIVGTLKT